MESGNKRICNSCGAELKEGASFCTRCGAPEVAPGGQAAAYEGLPPPPGPGGAVTVPGAPPGTTRRGKLPLVLGIIGGVLVAGGIVVLVLFLTVWSGAGGGTGDPIAMAEKHISSVENKDAESYMDCFQPGLFEPGDNPFGFEITREDMESMIEMGFEMVNFEISGVELEMEYEEGDKARVVTSRGTLNISTFGISEELDLSEEPLVFDMVKEGGRWYLTEDPMPMMGGMDFNLEDLEEFDFDEFDMEDF
ncbi:MAG: zinc-ribbon domain-containing protein [Actinomycetota bacterium]